jgi:hypothetical protein
MVNLRSIANRATSTINPNITATLRACTGYGTDDAGRQTPAYAPPAPVTLQAQALTKRDIEHLAGLNLSNAERAVYCNTQLSGVDRTINSGGDLLTFEGADWLVTQVLEDWSPTAGWCKVALTRQRGVTA